MKLRWKKLLKFSHKFLPQTTFLSQRFFHRFCDELQPREFGIVGPIKVTYIKFGNTGPETIIGKSVSEMKQKFYININNNKTAVPTP